MLSITRGVSSCKKLGLAKCNATKASLEMIQMIKSAYCNLLK